MWQDPTRHGPRNAYGTRNGATYSKGRSRIRRRMDEWAYRGWQLYVQENHLERSLQINQLFELRWDEKRIILYLKPYRRFGMPVVWKTWTRYFPSTSPCVAAYPTVSQYIRLSLQAEISLLGYILQMAERPGFLPLQLRIQDIHLSRAFVWR